MKNLQTYILETKGDPIDDQWLNDEKPVMTKDGHQVIITKNELVDYEWLDDGTCQKAIDQYGNPKKPVESDNLVKAN